MNKLTSKERSLLAGLAAKENAIFQLGKEGVTDNFIRGISAALEAREVVKISILKNGDSTAKTAAEGLASALNAEVVRVIGGKVILYRRSTRKGASHLLK